MKAVVLPNITDPPEVQADWLEWRALKDSESFISWTGYQRSLNQAGSMDAREGGEDQEEDDLLEDLINSVEGELTSRRVACGGTTSYPYAMSHGGIAYDANASDLTYRFLLLLSLFGKDAGPKDSNPERLFEDLCSLALHEYLGGNTGGLEREIFGFPRRVLPPHFPNALDALCKRLGEGTGSSGRKPAADQKDAKLDLVGWRAFPDGRRGKLIGFAQCATGDDWGEKAFELQPQKWCRLWMRDSAGVDPFASLFIPHRPGEDKWLMATAYAGVLFDRCRICWLVPAPQGQLAKDIKKWIAHVLGSDPAKNAEPRKKAKKRKKAKS